MAEYHGGQAAQPSHFDRKAWWQVGKRVKTEVSRDNLSVVAAGVAFYAFLSLVPALAALVSIYGLIANPADVQQMVQSASGVLPPAVVQIVERQLSDIVANSSSALGIGAVFGLLITLWSATKGTKSMMTALNIAYEESEERGFFKLNGVALLLTLGGILGVILAIVMVVAAPALLGNLGLPSTVRTAIDWLRWPLLALIMAVGLGVFYRYGPSREPARWRWLSTGAVVATVLWLVASGLFSWYVANFGSYNETYGSLAAVVILLLWFYVSAFVVLLGAELNSELEHQTAVDTTTGDPRPRGRRGAAMADRVAGEDDDRFKA